MRDAEAQEIKYQINDSIKNMQKEFIDGCDVWREDRAVVSTDPNECYDIQVSVVKRTKK